MLKQFKVIANWEETAYMIYKGPFAVNEDGKRTGTYIGNPGPTISEQWFDTYEEAQEVANKLEKKF